MKKNYLLLLLTAISLNLFSQQIMVLDSILKYSWETDDWILDTRVVCTYDSNRNITEEITNFWDSETNDWDWNRRDVTTYTYDINENLKKTIWLWSNGSDGELSEYINDINGNPIEVIRYGLDTSKNKWIEQSIFCPWGNCWISELGREDFIGAYGRVTYTYDPNGKLEIRSLYDWDSANNEWVIIRKHVFTYDEDNRVTEGVEYEWKSSESEWIPGFHREVYSYDDNGNLTEENNYYRDYEANEWVHQWRFLYTYDINKNLTEQIKMEGDPEANDWFNHMSYFCTYDANGNPTEEITNYWDSDVSDWIYQRKSVYYWSELTTSISNNPIDLNYIIYPNPTNDLVALESNVPGLHTIIITSLNGQLIYSTKTVGSTLHIDLSSFQKGIYFITIRSRDYMRTEKIIKL